LEIWSLKIVFILLNFNNNATLLYAIVIRKLMYSLKKEVSHFLHSLLSHRDSLH